MKNSPLITVLLIALAITSGTALVLCYVYNSRISETHSLKFQANNIETTRRMATSLAAEAIEYSKKNPSIEPVLEASGLKPKAGTAPTNKPAGK